MPQPTISCTGLIYPSEWWHFDFAGWQNYPVMDISFEDLLATP
jgi:hypothetical protein